jgi:hypothetical protein
MRLLHKARSPESAPVPATPTSGVAKPVGRFGFHFAEMCAVMCLGGGLLIGLFFAAASLLGFSEMREELPALSALIIAAILAAAMVVWMRFRRMSWRPTLEMAGSSVASGLVLVVGYWVGMVPEDALIPSVCLLACVAMLAVMLFRIPLYSSSHSTHQSHAG